MRRQNDNIVIIKNRFGKEYIIETADGERVLSVQVIISTGCRRTNLDEALAEEYLLYVKHVIYTKNDKMTNYVRMDLPSQYINRIKSNKARKSVANIFRTMYSYLYLMGWYTIENLNYNRANLLVDFLKNPSKDVESGGNLVRDNNTVAHYLTRIRSYVRWLGVRKDHPLLRSDIVMFIDKYGNRQVREKNEISVRHYSNDTIRYHITYDEYERIREAKCLESEYYRLLVKCIVDLMFRHGLRIGEVFAITLEDIYTDSDGETCVVIRNRFTKDKFRLAKGCTKVVTRHNYRDREYQTYDVGYQVVYLEEDVVRTLFAYMSATHEFLPPRAKEDKKVFRKRKKTYKTTVADTVANYINNDLDCKEMMLSKFRSIDKKNHYLFPKIPRFFNLRDPQILRP